jgi:hypothetical protein
MTTIRKNTDRLAGVVKELTQLQSRTNGLVTQLDGAVRAARRGDVPELGEIEALLRTSRLHLQREAATAGEQAAALRRYVALSRQVEAFIADYLKTFKSFRDGGGGSPGTFTGNRSASKEGKLREKRRGTSAEEFSPFLANTYDYGKDIPLFGDSTVLYESRTGVSWISDKIIFDHSGRAVAKVQAGRVKGGVRAHAELGLEATAALERQVQVGNKHLNINTTQRLSATAEAKASADVEISKTKLRAHAGGKVGVDVRAEAGGGAKVSGAEAKMNIFGSAGASAEAGVDGSLSLKKVGFKANLGATVGLGGGVSVDVSVNPVEVYHDAGHVAHKAKNLVDDIPRPHIHKSDLDPRHWI